MNYLFFFFFFQAEDGIRDLTVTGVQTCALPISRSCDKRPPEEVPESAAFLEIVEAREGEAPQRLFSGWMFASIPALAALENPIYDLWVLDCKNEASASGATTP